MDFQFIPINIRAPVEVGAVDQEPEHQEIEQNDIGALHVYIHTEDVEQREPESSSYTAKPIQSQRSPKAILKNTPKPSVWGRVLLWVGSSVTNWAEQPSDKDMRELLHSVDQLRHPPEDMTRREWVSNYTNLAKSASSVTKLGMTLLGFSGVANVLGQVSHSIGGFAIGHNYLDPEPNFKNLKRETQKVTGHFLEQRLSFVNERLKSAEDLSTQNRYEKIKELIETNQAIYSERSASAQSTEELVHLLVDLQEDIATVDDTYSLSSGTQDINTLLERARHTANRTTKRYEQVLQTADDAMVQVETDLQLLNETQDSNKAIKPSEISAYKRIRIELWKHKEALTELHQQLTDETADETSRMKAADKIVSYVESTPFQAIHEHMSTFRPSE